MRNESYKTRSSLGVNEEHEIIKTRLLWNSSFKQNIILITDKGMYDKIEEYYAYEVDHILNFDDADFFYKLRR